MEVTGAAVKRLLNAMQKSFTPDDMDRLLLECWDLHLHDVAANAKFGAQVVSVLSHFNKRNIAEHLIRAMRDARPHNADFIALSDMAGFTAIGPGLEAYLVPGQAASPDAVDFRVMLGLRENAVCRVEMGTSRGTGILVGPNLVLTNQHVVRTGTDGTLPAPVTCLFDHKRASNGYTTPTRQVKVTRVLASSPPAPEDHQAGEAVDPDRLDYALLELESDAGNDAIVDGFEPRGFVTMEPGVGVPDFDTGIIILQHPLAQPMKVDLGSVTKVAGTRIWHNAGTTKGSSGAPLFDVQLRLVGLHHAGYAPGEVQLPHNQAVPLALILADLKKKQIPLPA
jgi:S1-C subfamily serine protease